MASDFDDTDFVDRDFVAGKKAVSDPSNSPAAGTRPPSQEELEARLSMTQNRLADLKRAQELLEQERAAVEEARRRRAELKQGREEMARHLTRGLGILEQAEFAARRDAEQMAKTLADFRDALGKVQAINEETWTQESWETELTRALTAIENARMEWNGARLKWPVLDGEAAPGSGAKPVSGGASNPFASNSGEPLWKTGLALTWPLAAVALLALVVAAIALLRK
ncbi:MAG TPA: hypothetical protein VHH73_05935 [Verrucomicrobiae bacterium]|nr:hypothetical protein [Verrucomicrobiae bacterium]